MPYVNSLVEAVDTRAASVKHEVAVVTIDDVCRELGVVPSVIRMDVQGAEIHALRGARETIRAATAAVDPRRDAPAVLAGIRRDRGRRAADHSRSRVERAPLVDGEALFARDAHAVLTK